MEKQFRTVFEIAPLHKKISYGSSVLFTGSCFTENISEKLAYYKFNVNTNPFGIIYNPFSLVSELVAILLSKVFTEEDVFKDRGVYRSFHFHSRIADTDKNTMLGKMNDAVTTGHAFLKTASHLVITLGTANVYALRSSGVIVANNHKQPAQLFSRIQLTADAVLAVFTDLLTRLRTFNPGLQVIFTVSPVRHFREGAVDNMLSKSVLIHAVHEIIKQEPSVSYFPAYEIMMDDLRDYRFYADDMLHPNITAINYIFEKFKHACLDAGNYERMEAVAEIRSAMQHR